MACGEGVNPTATCEHGDVPALSATHRAARKATDFSAACEREDMEILS
jgi:hypothetical protein